MSSSKKTATSRPFQERSRHAVDSLLEAATRLFDQTAANGIAKLAGDSLGSLFESFPGKDAMLGQLFEAHVGEAIDVLSRALDAMDPERTALRDGVRTMVKALLDLHGHRPGLQRAFLERIVTVPLVRQRIADAERRLRGVLQAWLALHPGVAVPDVEVAARIVVDGTNALVHAYVRDAEGASESTFVEELTRLWTGYLEAVSVRA